jgi:HEAT repeat protein
MFASPILAAAPGPLLGQVEADAAGDPARALPAVASTPPVNGDVKGLARRLSDDRLAQSDRDEAALRLVRRNSPEARLELRRVLTSIGDRGGQLAVAKALATDVAPDPSFIDPLFALIGTDRALTDAAAQALGAYKNDAGVLDRLLRLATDRAQADARPAAMRALGCMVEKRAAAMLVQILGDEREPDAVRNAAADSLVAMTGLSANRRDPLLWQRW